MKRKNKSRPPSESAPRPSEGPTYRTVADLLEDQPRGPLSVLPVFIQILAAAEKSLPARGQSLELFPAAMAIDADGGVNIPTVSRPDASTVLISAPKYSSPEMFRAKPGAEQFQQASCVYVLGFIFYEILLGNLAFSSQFANADDQEEHFQWLNWHCDLSRPAKPLKEILPGFPPRLSGAIQSMMEKRLEVRTESLGASQEALSKLLRELKDQKEQEAAIRDLSHLAEQPPPTLWKMAAGVLCLLLLVFFLGLANRGASSGAIA